MNVHRSPLLRAGAAAAVTAAAAGAAIALAPAAGAAVSLVPAGSPYTVAYTDGDGVALRWAAAATARLSPAVVWRDGTPVTIVCQDWSPDTVGPRANHVFDRVGYPARSAPTWIPDAYVSGTAAANRFTPGIPRCGTSVAAPVPTRSVADRAIAWMSAQTGSTRFDRYCLAAVHQAYLSAGRDITAGLPFAAAHGSAATYWSVARDRHPGDHNAPRGALVFFAASRPGGDGHVAIALGDGRMITTWDGRTAGIHVMPIAAYDQRLYLGWAPA